MPRGVYVRGGGESAPQSDPQSAEAVNEPALSKRAADVRRERRMRDDGDINRMARMKLAIPRAIEEQAKREGKVCRWFLDGPGRLSEAHETDWDVVPDVGYVAAGQDDPQKLVLHWKYKDWHEDDMRRSEQALDEQERAMMAGQFSETRKAGDGLIVPEHQQNRISRKRGLV